jgi:hypothetical protein
MVDMLVPQFGCEKAIGRLEDSYNVTDLDSFSSLIIDGFDLKTLIGNDLIIKLNFASRHRRNTSGERHLCKDIPGKQFSFE